MKVLSIGPDKDLLKKGSISFERHIHYAAQMDQLHAVVFARKKYGKERVQIADNAWAYPTYSSSTLGLFLDAYRIGKNILQEPGEWVISAQDPFESGLVGYALARATRTPLLMQEHGDFFSTTYWRNESLMNRLRTIVGKYLIQRANHVRAVSKRIARTLESLGVQKGNITVTPVYTDVHQFENAVPNEGVLALKPKDGVLVVTMARFVAQKNLPLLLASFRRVLEKQGNAKLLLLGSGQEEGVLRGFVGSVGKDRVVFMDWTDDPAGVMKAADVYALSSNYEGWGRVCIEALAAGTPLIMTDVGCAGEVVRDGENGIVVPVGDEEAFTQGLKKLIEDSTLRDRLSETGTRTTQQLPTFEENVALYIQSLETCLHKSVKK